MGFTSCVSKLRPRLHGLGQTFARTKTCTVPPCVHMGPAELDEFFNGKGPVYTGPNEFLHGRILYLDRLFTWDRTNSVTDCSSVYMGPCKFWDQSRLCHDWLTANHVAVDGLRQIQIGDLDKNFTWTDKDINLLLHVVLDCIKKTGEGVDWITVKSKCEDLTKKFPEKVQRKGQIPPRFRRTKLQRRAHSKQIQLKKDQVNVNVTEWRQLQL